MGLFLFDYLCLMAKIEEDAIELYILTQPAQQLFVVRDRSQVNTIVISIGDEPD